MPDDYDKLLDRLSKPTGPTRSAGGSRIVFQPDDTDWDLGRIGELQDWYTQTYKKPLPMTNRGQGSIHNKLGLDHRGSSDISLHPDTPEGQAFGEELRRRNVPFLAFTRAIPGVSTGPHYHIGRPSHRNGAKFAVGAQVKSKVKPVAQIRPAQPEASPSPTPDPYDELLDRLESSGGTAATGDEYDQLLDRLSTTAEPASGGRAAAMARTKGVAQYRNQQPTGPAIREADLSWHYGMDRGEFDALPPAQRNEIIARTAKAVTADEAKKRAGTELTPSYEYINKNRTDLGLLPKSVMAQRGLPTTGPAEFIPGATPTTDLLIPSPMDRARTAEQRARIGKQVRDQLTTAATAPFYTEEAQLAESNLNSSTAIDAEVERRITAENTAMTRRRELEALLTPADRQAIKAAVDQVSPQGSVRRGAFTGSTRFGASLLYKIAGALETVGALETLSEENVFAPLTTYLRREAGKGDITIEEIEQNAPPEVKAKVADFGVSSIGALLEMVVFTKGLGTVGGFGALHGLETAGRGGTPGEISVSTGEGAVLGAVFKGAGALETPGASILRRTVQSTPAVAAGTLVTEKAFGHEDLDALQTTALNTLFHLGGKGYEAVAKLTERAAKDLKTPRPTVPDELQNRLTSRDIAEAGGEVVSAPGERPRYRVSDEQLRAMQGEAAQPAVEPAVQQRTTKTDDLTLPDTELDAIRNELHAELGPPTVPGVPKSSLAELMSERAAKGPDQPKVLETVDELLASMPRTTRTKEEIQAEQSRRSKDQVEAALFRTSGEGQDLIAEFINHPNPEVAARARAMRDQAINAVDAGIKAQEVTEAAKPVEQGVEVPATKRSYQEVQAAIDARETELEKQGVDVIRLYDSPEPWTKMGIEPPSDWKQMPPDLVKLYQEREGIGSKELEQNVNELTGRLKSTGLADAEIDVVLDAFSLKRGETDAIAQSFAGEQTQRMASQSPRELTEKVYMALAQKRGIDTRAIDSVEDVGRYGERQTLEDAAKAVRAIKTYFAGEPLPEQQAIAPPKPIVKVEPVEQAAPTTAEITGSGRNWTAAIETPSGRVVTEGFKSEAEARAYADNYGKQAAGPVVKQSELNKKITVEDEQVLRDSGLRDEEIRKGHFSVEKAKQGYGWIAGDYQPITNELLRTKSAPVSTKVTGDLQKLKDLKAKGVEDVTTRMAEEIWGSDARGGRIDALISRQEARIKSDQAYHEGLVRQNERYNASQPVKPGAARGEGGNIDLNEIRNGLRAGKIKIEDAVEQFRKTHEKFYGHRAVYGADSEARIRAVLNRDRNRDPFIGITDAQGTIATTDPLRNRTHSTTFHRKFEASEGVGHWRYEPDRNTLYWDDTPSPAQRQSAADYLHQYGVKNPEHAGLFQMPNLRVLWDEEIARQSKPHHAAEQPRNLEGTFAPGSPGSLEAERSLLMTAAREYQRDYRALEQHPARRTGTEPLEPGGPPQRGGLELVNEGVAGNYFARLRRFAETHKPEQVATVDRAEQLYYQGKYGEATRLSETALSGTHEYISKVTGAYAATGLVERGLPVKADWRAIYLEARRRIGETGRLGITHGGSAFYDINKYPEGGRADHSKIAYILEPVIEGIKVDAARLIAEGKLKASDWVAHVRSEMNTRLGSSDFSDWHPLNRSAAMGVVVDRLRTEGPPAGGGTPPPPGGPSTGVDSEGQPMRRASLPKTLREAGLEEGTITEYPLAPNARTAKRVEDAIRTDGIDAVEVWYRTAPPSPERTYAEQVLSDYYTLRATKQTDPAAAQADRARAVELANLEIDRSYTLGQAIQAYSMAAKYSPAGIVTEALRLAKKAGTELRDSQIADLTKAARDYKSADAEVRQARTELKELEAVGAPAGASGGGTGRGKGSGSGTGPSGRKPRGPNLLPSKTERVRERLDEAAKRRRAAKLFMARQLDVIAQSRTMLGYWKRSMNITRGLMVSGFQTAARNYQSQEVRFNIERLTDLAEHMIRTSIGLQSDFTSRSIWRATKEQLSVPIGKHSPKARATEIASEHPAELSRLFNTHAEGMDALPMPDGAAKGIERVFQTVERGVEMANFANRIQENHIRSVEFLAELDLHLRKDHNMSLERFVETEGIDQIPQALVEKAVSKALEVTFSDMPKTDGVGGQLLTSLIKFGNYLPPTLSPAAFPRFMFNNLKFLYQYNVIGAADIARFGIRNRKLDGQIKAVKADPKLSESQVAREVQSLEARKENVPRAIARTLIGSSMLLMAYGFRKSDHAGEKWYELEIGGHTLDARPFGPFSTYLFMAEAIRRKVNGEKAFTVEEIVSALGATTSVGGTAQSVAEKLYNYFAADEWEKAQRVLKTEAGEWGRALLTPFRQVKDLIAAFDASEGITRESADAPGLSPILESIPYASQRYGLPEVHRPDTATPVHQEYPGVKAVTGWRVQTPKTFIQREIDALHIPGNQVRSNTGHPRIDELEKALMGQRMDQLSKELESDQEYIKAVPAVRTKLLKDMMQDLREEVREELEGQHPELYEQLKEDRKSRDEKEYEKAIGSQGLSTALRLGVPVPVPARRSDEDDLAYRARLLQVGRAQRAKLDGAITVDFAALSTAAQRKRLHDSLT